jgi:hypothetical protein
MKRILASLLLVSLVLATSGARGGEEAAGSKVDDTLKDTLQDAGLPTEPDANGDFHLSLKFKTGRSQTVVVQSGRVTLGDAEDDEDQLREVYSVAYTSAAPPPAELAAKLLLESSSARIGGWVVRKNGDKFEIVYRAFIPAEACDHAVKPAIGFVAMQADALEQSQTGKDEN